jgi:hypothetical protein
MGLLDTSSGRSALTGSFSGKLLTRSFASSRLAGSLFGTGHCLGLVCVFGKFQMKEQRFAFCEENEMRNRQDSKAKTVDEHKKEGSIRFESWFGRQRAGIICT